MSDTLAAALIGVAGVVIGVLARFLYDSLKERREGGEKAAGKAIEILTGRFDRADDPADRAAIERLLREIENDYLPYLRRKMTTIINLSRDVLVKLAPTGAIAPDMPELSPPDREALQTAVATIQDLDPPKTAEDHLSQGNAFYAAGDFERALAAYDRALELSPNQTDVLHNRGFILYTLRRYDEALTDFNRAVELSSDDPTILSLRAITLADLKRYDEALADYNRCLQLRPDHPRTLSNRGHALIELGRHDEALADFNRSLQLRPDYPRTIYNRARVYCLMGQLKESLSDLEEAISRDAKFRKIARHSEDFTNLRSDPKLGPEFQRLVAEPED